jgi:hypothetical protein
MEVRPQIVRELSGGGVLIVEGLSFARLERIKLVSKWCMVRVNFGKLGSTSTPESKCDWKCRSTSALDGSTSILGSTQVRCGDSRSATLYFHFRLRWLSWLLLRMNRQIHCRSPQGAHMFYIVEFDAWQQQPGLRIIQQK